MFDLAATATADPERPLWLARVVTTTGMGSGRPVDAALFDPTGPVAGTLLSGVADDEVRAAVASATADEDGVPQLLDLHIGDAQAHDKGLTCGGHASVLVQPAADVPEAAWALVARSRPVALVTDLVGELGRTSWLGLASAGDDGALGTVQVRSLFARGTQTTATVEVGERRLLVTALWPTPSLLVVGEGLIADALVAGARFLGWTASVVDGREESTAALEALGPGDGIVVLSHDRAVDAPVLAAALRAEVGYVAALGSRHTQQARREWFDANGVDEADQARIHGPAGLDIGARTPQEITVAILAEMLAARSNTNAASLSRSDGPIHSDGLHAPPPRQPVEHMHAR